MLAASSFEADLAECLESDEMIAEALNRSVSLRDYSVQVDEELAFVEAESVREYVAQSGTVALLEEKMRVCDEGFGIIQDIVSTFSKQLGGVADEVRKVGERSKNTSRKVANRVAAERVLSDYLRRLVLPSDAEAVVDTADVLDATFVSYAALVDARLDELGREPRDRLAVKDAVAGEETKRRLEGLKVRIVQRSRDEILSTILNVRTGDRESLERRNGPLRTYGGPLLHFLEKRFTPASLELRGAYIEASSRALHTLLKAYNDELYKHELPLANRHDLVSVQESSVRSVVTSRVSLAKRGDAFSLGDRESVLANLDAPALRVSLLKKNGVFSARAIGKATGAAPKQKTLFPCEELFRSSLKRFRDACASEKSVVDNLFGADADGVFCAVVQKSSTTTVDRLEARTKDGHDIVGLALIARLLKMARDDSCVSKLMPLASFYDACEDVVWTRIRSLVAANIESARKANPHSSAPSANKALISYPHFVTRRFAELAATVVALFPENHGEDDANVRTLRRDVTETLRDEFLALLARLSREYFADSATKERVVFLANNYDQVVTVLDERSCENSQLRTFFDVLLARQREAYVDATLDEGISSLVEFVKKTERHFSSNNGNHANLSSVVDPDYVQTLARDFSNAWEPLLAKINKDVIASFSNFKNGTQVLKMCFTQLLLYYTRFQEIVKKTWRRAPPPIVSELVTTATILSEIKKYTRSYD